MKLSDAKGTLTDPLSLRINAMRHHYWNLPADNGHAYIRWYFWSKQLSYRHTL